MTLQAALRERLRSPWFLIAVAASAIIPIFWFGVAFLQPDGIGTEGLIANMGLAAVSLLPLLLFFLVAAAPERRTRQEALTAYVADVAMMAAAFAIGWGTLSVIVALRTGAGARELLAAPLLLVTSTVLFAAFRGAAGACDGPGLDTGRLLRRLFVLYLVIHYAFPLASQLLLAARGESSPYYQPGAPEETHRLLIASLVPETYPGYGIGESVTWSPWFLAAILLLWVVVPLALLLRNYPKDAPAPPPPGDETAA